MSEAAVPTFLPATDQVPSGQEQLDALQQALDPTQNPVDLIVTQAPPPPVGRSYSFDFVARRFVLGPGHSPISTIGTETLQQWVEKCLSTERGAYSIYPPGYGLANISDLFGGPVTSSPPIDLEQRISDALTFHPRIASVTDFGATVDPDDEYVSVAFTVVTDRDETVPIPPVQVSL